MLVSGPVYHLDASCNANYVDWIREISTAFKLVHDRRRSTKPTRVADLTMWSSSQATRPRTCESGGWQRTNSTSCSILSNHQNWLQISSANCMKEPPWFFQETTVLPNLFYSAIASPPGNLRGLRIFRVTDMRNTPPARPLPTSPQMRLTLE
jgi:hypothetical protein